MNQNQSSQRKPMCFDFLKTLSTGNVPLHQKLRMTSNYIISRIFLFVFTIILYCFLQLSRLAKSVSYPTIRDREENFDSFKIVHITNLNYLWKSHNTKRLIDMHTSYHIQPFKVLVRSSKMSCEFQLK